MGELECEEQQQPLLARIDTSKLHNPKPLQVLNFLLLVAGSCGYPLLLRLYFVSGGDLKWFSALLGTAGWPILALPLAVSYRKTALCSITAPVFLSCVGLGILAALYNVLYTFGMSRLPASTTTLLSATQLAFTCLFAFAIVRQQFTRWTVSAVVMLIAGTVVLGSHPTADLSDPVRYYVGFAAVLGSMALYGLQMPLVELTYAKAEREVTHTLLLEMQLVMGFMASAFSAVGMVANGEFLAIAREAKDFELGEARYYIVVVSYAIFAQMALSGTIGVVFYGSALLTGIIVASLIPVVELLAVLFFDESFTSSKIIALGFSILGFVSYFYGEFKKKTN